MNQEQGNEANRDPADAADQDEAFVQQRLESFGQVEPLDAGFRGQLSQRLDAEFASVAGSPQTSGAGQQNVYLATRRPVFEEDSDGRPRKHGRRFSGWLSGIVAASVVLGIFAFWTAQPLTSWAEMIEALKSKPWVQTDSGRTSSWFSASSQVVARRNADRTMFVSRNEGTQLRYDRDSARIYQTPAAQVQRPLDRDLIEWLVNSFGGSIDADADWTVIHESARLVDEPSGRWLKLTVVFESIEPRSQLFTAVFVMDPKSKLPVSCELGRGDLAGRTSDRRQGARDWQSVSFDYPTEGPASIYDLGVASNTPIVRSDEDPLMGVVAALAELTPSPVKAHREVDLVRQSKPKPTLEQPKTADNNQADAPTNNDARPSPPAAVKVAEAAKLIAKKDPVVFEPTAKASPLALKIVPIPATTVAMTARVDQLVDELWKQKKVAPAESIDDEAFLRRVYLDVIGRVPTIGEYEQFFELDADTRRSQLIDLLLDSREHALHMGGIWKRVLVPDDETAISRLGGSGKLEQWLSDAFAKNRPYNELVREILLAEGRVNESGPLLFYAAAKMNAEELAARTSRTFLGMRMECAECHDHPFDHWSQEDFWGLAAYFAQISRPQGKIEMVSPVLRVRDADFGDVKLPESETVILPSLPISLHASHGMTEADVTALKEAEITDGSRRQQLAAWITHPQNSHFAQATTNRIWAHLFGVGLVDPVDDMGGHNIPSSPQLLNQLGRYFVQSDFDLRSLMRVLLNSRAYQLSSQNEQQASSDVVDAFARMSLKPLTAEQLYDCLATATGRTDLGRQVQMSNLISIAANVDRFSDPGRTAFLAQFRTSVDQRTDYQAGIPQALTLMNGPMIHSATKDAPKGILRSLSAPFFDDETRIEKLFVATLSRKPTDEEKERYIEFLSSQPEGSKKSETLGDMLWVLLNSTEFTMNH